MLGLITLEVYISIPIITEQNNKFEIYKIPDSKRGGVSYEKVRDEIERDLEISDITATDLPDEIIGPIIIKEYREQVFIRREDDGYMRISAIFKSSIFQDFESFLRTEIDLVEDDIGFVLDEYNSSVITYEITPGIYTFRHLSEILFNILQPEYELINNPVDIEFDDITMKIKLVVRSGIIAVRFDEESFFSTILGFKPYWDYKHYDENISQKFVNSGTTKKIHLKRDVIDGSVVYGIRVPILFSFVLYKRAGYKIFYEPESIHQLKNM